MNAIIPAGPTALLLATCAPAEIGRWTTGAPLPSGAALRARSAVA